MADGQKAVRWIYHYATSDGGPVTLDFVTADTWPEARSAIAAQIGLWESAPEGRRVASDHVILAARATLAAYDAQFGVTP